MSNMNLIIYEWIQVAHIVLVLLLTIFNVFDLGHETKACGSVFGPDHEAKRT